MGVILASQELKRVFQFTKKGKTIVLPDIDPNLDPSEIVKYYSGQYPELTNAKIEAPEYAVGKDRSEDDKGNADMVFNIKTEVGTKG